MDERHAKLIERSDLTLRELEDAEVARLNAALEGSYNQLEVDLLRRYPNYTADSKPGLLATQRGVLLADELKEVLSLVNPSNEAEYERRFNDLIGTASKEGATLSGELIKLQTGDSFVPATATVPIEAVAFAAKDSVKRLNKHSDQFREEATVIIAQGLIQGQSSRKVADVLRQRLSVTKGRAEAIARTEVISAQDSATRLNYKTNGIEYVVRIATQDNRLCGYCAARAGQVYPVDQAPAVLHPLDRCYNAPWLPEYEQSDPEDSDWLKKHARESQSATTDKIRLDAAPFERTLGAIAPRLIWSPKDGYLDKSAEAKGQNWGLGLLAATLILRGQSQPVPAPGLPIPIIPVPVIPIPIPVIPIPIPIPLPIPGIPKPPEEENQLLKALVIGAAIAGTSVAAYYIARQRYRSGFKQSATKAVEMSQKFKRGVQADRSENDDAITFVVGGFSGEKGGQGLYLGEYFQTVLPTHRVVGVRTAEFDVEDPGGAPTPEKVSQVLSKMLGTAVVEGRNESAIKVAAQAYAFNQKYPDKPVNVIGYSGGGFTAFEAAEILKEMGITAKVVAIGTPYFGFNDIKPDQGITIAGEGDPWAQLTALNRVSIKGIKNHSLEQYLPDATFTRTVQDFLKVDQPSKKKPKPETVETKPNVDDEELNRLIDQLIPQLALLSEKEIAALPPAIARRLLRARRDAGVQTPGRLDPKQLPGIPEIKMLPGYAPLLALPEAQKAKALLRGQLPDLTLPPSVELAPVQESERVALENRMAQQLYRQARSYERGMSRLVEGRTREAIAKINQQKLPPAQKLQALRKVVFDEVSAIATPTNLKPPGAANAEDFSAFQFGGVRWHAPGQLKETSPALDTLRKLAELGLPNELLQHVDTIYISRQKSAAEEFWRKKLKLPTPRVPATTNLEDSSITFYRGRAKVDDLIRQNAYLAAYQRWGQLEPPEGSDYARAMQEGRPSTAYGLTGPAQDFADSVKEFFVDPDHLKRFAPQRYEAISRMFNFRHPEAPAQPRKPDTRSPQIINDLRSRNVQLQEQVRKQRDAAEALASQQRSSRTVRKAIADQEKAQAKLQGSYEGAISSVRIQDESLKTLERQVQDIEGRYSQLLNPLNRPYFTDTPDQIKAAQRQLTVVQREVDALDKIAASTATVQVTTQKLQAALDDLATRRDSLKTTGDARRIEDNLTQLRTDLDAAEQELIALPRSNERSQALRDLQRLKAAANSQRTVTVADLQRQAFEPRIAELRQLGDNLAGLQQRVTDGKSKLSDLQRRLGQLPTRTSELSLEQQERYNQIKRTRTAQGKLPERVQAYRELRTKFNEQMAGRSAALTKRADDYQLSRQSAINNVQAAIQDRVELINSNLQELRSFRPGSIAWLVDAKNWENSDTPNDLAIVIQSRQGRTRAERLQEASKYVTDLIVGTKRAIREIGERLEFPNEVSRNAFYELESPLAELQQFRTALSSEEVLSDRKLQSLLKQPEKIKAVDLIQYGNRMIGELERFNQEFVELLLGAETTDPRAIIEQSGLYKRAREAFLNEVEGTRATIAADIEDAIATGESLKQRIQRDQAEPLIYDVGGRARTVEDLRKEIDQSKAEVNRLLNIQELNAKVEATEEEATRQKRRQEEMAIAQQRQQRLQTLRDELAEVNRDIQKRREAAARGQKRGIATDRLEARQRRILKDIEKLGRESSSSGNQ